MQGPPVPQTQALFETRLIDETSSYLDAVKSLWRTNSGVLGFFPEGAFDERARRKQIIGAFQGRTLAGYALYYTNRKVRLTHLCVDEDRRGEGVAEALVDALRRASRGCVGIGLNCRRDYPVWMLWPKLGFVALNEQAGRGMDRYDFIAADETQGDHCFATTTTIAVNTFVGRVGRAARAVGGGEWSLDQDVIVRRGGRVMAVLSHRGNRRPDVMILDVMRAAIAG
jgi:GNAT superfamily N-acetyltransferase